MWKCNPNDINACLNCQYPECVRLNDEDIRDEYTDILEKEIFNNIPRDNNQRKWFKYSQSEKGKERARKYIKSDKGRAKEHRKSVMRWAVHEERNKGMTYGYCVRYAKATGTMPTVQIIAKDLNFSEPKAREYLRKLADEKLIFYKESIAIL